MGSDQHGLLIHSGHSHQNNRLSQDLCIKRIAVRKGVQYVRVLFAKLISAQWIELTQIY